MPLTSAMLLLGTGRRKCTNKQKCFKKQVLALKPERRVVVFLQNTR